MYFRKKILELASYKPPLSNRLTSGMSLLDFNERSSSLSLVILNKLEAWCRSGVTHIYPDYEGLLEKIADYTKSPVQNIFIGNGSDQLIDCVMRAVLDRDETILLPSPSFAMYAQLANLTEAKIITYNLLSENILVELEEQLKLKPRMVILCQPNNPTGGMIPPMVIDDLLKKYPETWFFIDEAYFEFSRITQLKVSPLYDNLIISRTFSKAFGLAALRIGYMVASEKMIEQCAKIRGPYDVNQFACFAAGVVLEHKDEIQAYIEDVMLVNKPKVEEALRSLDVTFLSSKANFINIFNAMDLADHFLEKGLRVRVMSQPELKNAFRLSIGDAKVTELTLEALASYKK